MQENVNLSTFSSKEQRFELSKSVIINMLPSEEDEVHKILFDRNEIEINSTRKHMNSPINQIYSRRPQCCFFVQRCTRPHKMCYIRNMYTHF